MASHSYATIGFSLLQELGSNEIIKVSFFSFFFFFSVLIMEIVASSSSSSVI